MLGRRGLVLIDRPRVRDHLSSTPIAILQAPGGYGKSTAWAQLGASLDVATVRMVLRRRLDTTGVLTAMALGFRRAGLAVLADAVDVEDPDATIDHLSDRLHAAGRPVLLAIDEVHRATPDAAGWIAALAGELPDGTRLVLAGRRLDPALATLGQRQGATVVGVDELRFDRDETAAVLAAVRGWPAETAEVQAVLASTDGWPAAIVLAAGRDMRAAGRSTTGASNATVLSGLVDGLLDVAGPATRELVESIVDLPLLSAGVIGAVGGAGALDRLLEAGMPIRFRADGWADLPDPVRELFQRRPLPLGIARIVAGDYARGGELAEAAALLHRHGDHDGVAELLASSRRDALERAGLSFFDAIVSDTPDDALARHPAALVNLVRAAQHQRRLRWAWIERATRVLASETPPRRAVEAERALDVARAGDLAGAALIASGIIAAAGSDEVVTRGRAHVARALCLLLSDTAGSTVEVGAELELAIGLFSLAGERSWEAEAHQALGYGVHFTTGAFDLAIERLDRALALRPAADAARADTLTVIAEVLTRADRLDDAAVALREASAIGHRLGDSRSIGYAAWSAAVLACQRRDLAAAVGALEQAEAHPEGWFEQLAGIDFLSNASEIRATLGDAAGARRDVERAEARARGTAREGAPLAARARVEAMFGDPRLAITTLDALDASPFAYRGDRWLRLLLRAVCHARLGDAEEAAALLRRAHRAAADDTGDPDRIARQEPELQALAAPGAAPADGHSSAVVVLLGRFAVERDGVDVSPPPGRPATLVKLVALQGTVTVDEAIDILWPEADIDTGRARLRNVLNRIRSASGPVIDRSDGALSLAAQVSVDAHRFEQDAAAALAAPVEERVGLARRALTRSTGELLAADLYADWATVPRERLRRRHLALLDVVAEDAIARGDLDEAGRLLDTAITTDALEEVRYVRLARALLAQGRARQAGRVAAQALAVAADLGVDPGRELQALVTELGAQA